MKVVSSKNSFSISDPGQCFYVEDPYPGLCRICFVSDINLQYCLPGVYSFREYFLLRRRLSRAFLFRRKRINL